MSKNPRLTWRMRAQSIAIPASLLVGLIFRILGKYPFDPFDLWGENPLNIPFLWISATAFIVAVVLLYTILPLARVEMTRKNTPIGKELPSFWYEDIHTMPMILLAYGVLFPGLCIMEIFQILAVTSQLEIFSWLADAAFLVTMVTDIVGVVLMIKGLHQRARRRAKEQGMEQQAII